MVYFITYFAGHYFIYCIRRNFKSKQRSVLIKHIDLHIGLKIDHHQEAIQLDDSTEIYGQFRIQKAAVLDKENFWTSATDQLIEQGSKYPQTHSPIEVPQSVSNNQGIFSKS